MNELGANISGKLKSLLNGGGVENGKPKCLGAVPDDSELFAYARANNIPDWVCTDWKYWQLEPKREPLKNWMGSLKWFARLKMASEPPNLQGDVSELPNLQAQGDVSELPNLQTQGDVSELPNLQGNATSSQIKYLELLDHLRDLEPGKSSESTLQMVKSVCRGIRGDTLLAWCRRNAAQGFDNARDGWLERLKTDWAKQGQASGNGSGLQTQGNASGNGSGLHTQGIASGNGSGLHTQGIASGNGSELQTQGNASGNGSGLHTQGNASGNGSGLHTQGNANGPKHRTEFDAVMYGLLSNLPHHDVSGLLASGQKNQVLAWLEENAAFGVDSCCEWVERLKADLAKSGNRAIITAPKQDLDMPGESAIGIGQMVARRQSPSLPSLRQNKRRLKEKFSFEDVLTRLQKEVGPREAYLTKAKKTIERLSKLGAEIVRNWKAANAQAVNLPSGAQIQKVNVFTDAMVGMTGFTNDFLRSLKPDETELLQKFALSMKYQAIALGVLTPNGIDETRLESVKDAMKAALLELMEKFRELTACILISHGRFVTISSYDVENPVYLSGVDLLKCGGVSPINGQKLLGLSIDGNPITDTDVTKIAGWVLSAIWRQSEAWQQKGLPSKKIIVAGMLASDLPSIGSYRRGTQKISRLEETLERGSELELTLATKNGKKTEKLGFRPILGDGRKAQFFNVAGNGGRLFEAAKNSKGKTILTRERAKTARAIANRLDGKGIRLTKSKPADFAAMIAHKIATGLETTESGAKFIYMDDWDKLGQYAQSSKKDRVFEAVVKATESVLGSNRWAFAYAHIFKKTLFDDSSKITMRKTCLVMELLGSGSVPNGAKAVYTLEKSEAKNKLNAKWWCRKFSGFNRITTNHNENFDLFQSLAITNPGLVCC